MLIGLTGGMGSGKSTVSGFLRELGARIIDADEISREIVRPGMPAWKELVEEFGKVILHPDDTIDRVRLGRKVFNSPKHLNRLNEITHPRIIDEIKKRIRKTKLKDPGAPIVVDAALLIESGYHSEMDIVIVVDANEELQVKRIIERNLLSITEARRRIRTQMPLKDKLKYADFVIDNNGTIQNTKEQVKKVYKDLIETISG